MSQPRSHSLIEAFANTAIGFVISLAAVSYLFPLFGIEMSVGDNFTATTIMTFVSVVRSYALRRVFNSWGRA